MQLCHVRYYYYYYYYNTFTTILSLAMWNKKDATTEMQFYIIFKNNNLSECDFT